MHRKGTKEIKTKRNAGDATPTMKEEETKRLEHQYEVLHQKLSLLAYEEKVEMEEQNKLIEKQQKQIKKLRKEVIDLNVLIGKNQAREQSVIEEAFHKCSKEVRFAKGKTPAEVTEILEERIFNLKKRKDILTYEINKKQIELGNMKQMCSKADEPSQYKDLNESAAEHAKHLENDSQKVEMRIEEMEHIQGIYKELVDLLVSDLGELQIKTNELEKLFEKHTHELQSFQVRETRSKVLEKKAEEQLHKVEEEVLKIRQEKDKAKMEFNQILDQKQTKMVDRKRKEKEETEILSSKYEIEKTLADMRINQERQLEEFNSKFEQIKIATGATNIDEVQKRLISQKMVRANLLKLQKKYERMLKNLKEEKERLQSEIQNKIGADITAPKKTFEDLEQYKHEQELQKKNKVEATKEFEHTVKLLSEIKTSLWNILQLIHRHLGETDLLGNTFEYNSVEIAKKINLKHGEVMKTFEGLDYEQLLEETKQEQFFSTRLEDGKNAERTVREEDKHEATSSEDEEIKKRTNLKKEALELANLKRRQKMNRGGRSFKMSLLG